MKKTVLLFPAIFFLFACKEKVHTIQVTNQSNIKFDSVIIFGAGTKISFSDIETGKKKILSYEVKEKGIGDDAFTGYFYSKDTMINFTGFAYHSAPADVPERIHLVIDKDLKIKTPPTE